LSVNDSEKTSFSCALVKMHKGIQQMNKIFFFMVAFLYETIFSLKLKQYSRESILLLQTALC
jgi:hypothetical protein